MALIDATVSAITDGSYGMVNSIIGQIKTILLNDPNVTVISDNNPANSVARILIYQVGGSAHYFKVYASGTSVVSFILLKIDGSTALGSSITRSISSGISYVVRFLYNTDTHLLTIDTSASATSAPKLFAFNAGDVAGWYHHYCAYDPSYVFPANSDTGLDVYMINYPFLESGGKFVGIPRRYGVGGVMNTYVHNYIWRSDAVGSTANAILTDTLGKKYLQYYNGNYSTLVKDP